MKETEEPAEPTTPTPSTSESATPTPTSNESGNTYKGTGEEARDVETKVGREDRSKKISWEKLRC